MRTLTKGKRVSAKPQLGTEFRFSRHTGTKPDGTGTGKNSAKLILALTQAPRHG